MSDRAETRAEELSRTSEVYRRLRAAPLPPPVVAPGPGTPPPPVRDRPKPAPPRSLPEPRGSTFLRRLFTRRPDQREILLLALVVGVFLLI